MSAFSTTVRCPNCLAQVDAPCTAPTPFGRRDVKWFHAARTTKAGEYLNHSANVLAYGDIVRAECACGWSEKVYDSTKETEPGLLEAIKEKAPAAIEAHLRSVREDVSG